MKTGICNLPLLPLRSEPSECSEMMTQVLFGELFEVLEEYESWSKIRVLSDNYIGWCTTKMLQILPLSFFDTLKTNHPAFMKALLSPCLLQDSANSQLLLPAGSRLYFYDEVKATFSVFKTRTLVFNEPVEEHWSVDPLSVAVSNSLDVKSKLNDILTTARSFMNAPYLWGGKSILGIDCSGLVQLAFSIHGCALPRDARDQALQGEVVADITSAEAGDLAFFVNASGKVVHVGILLDRSLILHASGSVHIDSIDAQGIYSEQLDRYTHRLHSVKRIFSIVND